MRASSSRCWLSLPPLLISLSARSRSLRRRADSRSAASARLRLDSASLRASWTCAGRPVAMRSRSSMRSRAESRRATTAAASSRSRTELPWTPGSGLVRRSSVSASCSARAASRAASSSATHGVGSVGRKTTRVPAVRQPSHGCGSSSIAWRSARTTTGCCWRMRSSIRFSGSSKPRSSRNSEKSKPSSSLTGTKTASTGNVRPSACLAWTPTRPGTVGAVPSSRKLRHVWAAAGRGSSTSVPKNDWPRISCAGRPNSSSAGSDHLETEPWPSVRTK